MGDFLKQSRHGSTFYFRRRVPNDLRPRIGKAYLIKTLGTGKRRDAIILARILAAQTDSLFQRIRAMPDHDFDPRIDLIFKLDLNDLGGLKSIYIEADTPEEQAHANAMLASALEKLPSSAPPPPPAKSTGKTLSQAWESYKAEKIVSGAWRDGEDTAKYDHLPHVRALIEVIGDKLLAEITADDINKFQTHVLSDPKGGSPRNRDKRLTRAGAVLRWAKVKRLIADDFTELFCYPSNIEANSYAAFDANDLKALFESVDYKKHAFKTPSEYWLPILALHTGARLNELCQLTVTDIGRHDEVETISILDGEMGKRLKNAASRRVIPIHSRLIELGFLDYVKTIKAGRIFPELPEDPARPGNFGAKVSEQFTAYRRKCGVGAATGRSNKTFHSFRSTLISALRKAGVPKDRRTRLAGHEYDDTQDKNYHGGDVLGMFDFTTLRADIELARFDITFTPYRVTT